jgi:uncharacterized protein
MAGRRPFCYSHSQATLRPSVVFSLRIPVDRLTETPLELDFDASPDWWRERCGQDPELAEGVEAPVVIEARAHRMGEDVYLEGEARGELSLACGRCLTRYRAPVRERFRLVLEPAGHRVPADPEGAASLDRDGLYLSDELEAGWFRGSEIRLDRFLQEVIALWFPAQPLCREECQGLCPRCGIDRNEASCECEEARPVSPFAVLEALRDRVR